MIPLALIWLAALVLAIAASRHPFDPRRTRLWLLVGAVLIGLALTAQVLA